MSAFILSGTNEARLMKVLYGEFQEKQFNKANVIFGRAKKLENFEGSQIEFPVEQSIGGGVAAGSLPTAATNKIAKAVITAKKLYALALVDRESMKASRSDKGAFIRATRYPVKVATQAMHRNIERMVVRGDATGTGALITGNASNSVVTGAGTSGDPYLVDFDVASTYFPAHFEQIEEGDTLNVNTETTALEVTAVTVTESAGYATATISLVGTSSRLATLAGGCGTAFGASDKLYMQLSKDNEMIGLSGALQASSSTLYSISVGRRWKAYQKAASAALSTDLLNEVVTNVTRLSGESPNLILMHSHQYIKLLNLLEDQKTYNLPAKDSKFKGQISFAGIEFMSPNGPIPVMMSRFVDSDKVYVLNDNHMAFHFRPGGLEWDADFDGQVFMRKDSADQYEARYIAYGQFFVNPHFQGILTSVTV